MIVETQNSIYEIDEQDRQVRRLEGFTVPTARFGANGAWRPYAHLSPLEVGKRMVITWPATGEEDFPGGELKTHTVTSEVVEISR